MNIIGHQKTVENLKQKAKDGNYSQAYIFSGPEGVGKYFLAQEFARWIIEGKEPELDILRLQPEQEEKKGIIKIKEITVEQVREKQKELATFPYSGKAKILIIDGSDRMTVKAQNAMLKTIEEPNSTAVIILITSRLEKILPTVKSRCHIINFNLVSRHDLEAYLASQGSDFSQEVIDFAMGRPGMMMELIKDPEKIEWYRNAKQKMVAVLGGNLGAKLKIAEELAKNVPEASKNLDFWLWILEQSGSVQDIWLAEKIKEAADKLKNTNANARILLENTFINIS